MTGTPRWSPNGQQIAFDSRAPGNADIFVMDSQGGPPRQLTNETSADVIPSWSRDGRWIYFASARSGFWEVWKMPSAGGPAEQVTRHGGYGAFESADGKFLYYTKYPAIPGIPGIWRMPTSGGEETLANPSVRVRSDCTRRQFSPPGSICFGAWGGKECRTSSMKVGARRPTF